MSAVSFLLVAMGVVAVRVLNYFYKLLMTGALHSAGLFVFAVGAAVAVFFVVVNWEKYRYIALTILLLALCLAFIAEVKYPEGLWGRAYYYMGR
jgi:hypothetical protein